MNISDIVLKRPFKIRNADEFADQNVLELFVDPTIGVSGPFDYGNEIVKGQMGTGKTMYLRANYIYYLSILVPQMIEQDELILPIYIKLSDYQNLKNPESIYNKILLRIIQELLDTCDRIQSASELVKLHKGVQDNIYGMWLNKVSMKGVIDKLNKLSSDEYVKQVTTELKGQGTIGNTFAKACGEYGKKEFIELKQKVSPQIEDISLAYESLLRPINAKLLILFDEVGSINKCFFEEHDGDSYFETLMNQLRTKDFIRTKIAIYPYTFADVLTETRYGDVVTLEDDIYTMSGYDNFLTKTLSIAEKYLSASVESDVSVEEVFDISQGNMQTIEQIIYASGGNMRRLVQLFDSTLNECYKRCNAIEKVNITDVLSSINWQANQMESLYTGDDLEFLHNLAKVCKKRTAYRFRFPNKSPALFKYTNKSSEYNVIKVKEIGAGRKGTTYWFDYAYCVYADIPTHYQFDSERIARSRSKEEGEWITTITKLTDELLIQANIPGKIEGTIGYLNPERTAGFINDGTRDDIFFTKNSIIKSDQAAKLVSGKRVRFFPITLEKSITACEIEIL